MDIIIITHGQSLKKKLILKIILRSFTNVYPSKKHPYLQFLVINSKNGLCSNAIVKQFNFANDFFFFFYQLYYNKALSIKYFLAHL